MLTDQKILTVYSSSNNDGDDGDDYRENSKEKKYLSEVEVEQRN